MDPISAFVIMALPNRLIRFVVTAFVNMDPISAVVTAVVAFVVTAVGAAFCLRSHTLLTTNMDPSSVFDIKLVIVIKRSLVTSTDIIVGSQEDPDLETNKIRYCSPLLKLPDKEPDKANGRRELQLPFLK